MVDPAETGLIHFDSNDYLSLSHDPRIARIYQEAYARFPTGSGASMMLSGYHPNHQAVEEAFAHYLDVDACILCGSGYAANLAVTAFLGALGLRAFIDKKVHASIYDGLKLAEVPYMRFIHNVVDDLSLKIKDHFKDSVCITEGVFSMTGQVAPLSMLSSVCMKFDVPVMVDEAHSFGVMGDEGRGAVAHFGLTQNEIPIRIIPLGKAYAAQGAIIAGKREWIEAILQAGRSLIYSTSISPALSYGLLHTLDFVVKADAERVKLEHLIACFREHIKASSLTWRSSHTPIQQLQLGDPVLALDYQQKLQAYGLSCKAVRTPTVSLKETGLRIILNAHHEPHHIEQLFNALGKIQETI